MCTPTNSEQNNDPVQRQIEIQRKTISYLRDTYISRYLQSLSAEYPYSVSTHDKEKVIWQYWDKGVDNAPPIVKACIHSVKKNLPQGYKHVILSDENIDQYVNIPDWVYEKHKENKSFNTTFFSDLLRLFLLSKYGGVWVDASVLFTSKIPSEVLESDFFCFYRGKEPKNVDIYEKFNPMYFSWREGFQVKMANSFLVASKSHPYIEALKSILLAYWKNESEFSYYFIFQLVFEDLVQKSQFMGLNRFFKDDLDFHKLLICCKEKYSKAQWQEICNTSFAHKLTYYRDAPEGSFFNLIEKEELVK